MVVRPALSWPVRKRRKGLLRWQLECQVVWLRLLCVRAPRFAMRLRRLRTPTGTGRLQVSQEVTDQWSSGNRDSTATAIASFRRQDGTTWHWERGSRRQRAGRSNCNLKDCRGNSWDQWGSNGAQAAWVWWHDGSAQTHASGTGFSKKNNLTSEFTCPKSSYKVAFFATNWDMILGSFQATISHLRNRKIINSKMPLARKYGTVFRRVFIHLDLL